MHVGRALFVLLVGCANCSRPRAVVEDRGPLLLGDVAASGAATFAWLSGGEEIGYVSAASELMAVRIADGARRQLDPARPCFQTDLARSRDGSALYFIAEDLAGGVPRYKLREALAHKEPSLGEIVAGNPAVSADARRVLYWTASGGAVLDASGAIFSASTCPASRVLPVLSASGDQLLSGDERPFLITVTDGSMKALPDTQSSLWRAVHWDGSGPQAVALIAEAQGERVYLVDVANGEMRALYQPDQGLLDLADAAISYDGRRVAFWETECLHADSLLSCQSGQTEARLKVVEVSSGRAETVASGGDSGGRIAFSDDGARVAYLFQAALGGALHVRPLKQE